jgi:hypothetical protein
MTWRAASGRPSVEGATWASTEYSKPESEEQTVQNWSATREVGLSPCHGGRGESRAPPYTHAAATLSVCLSL